MNTPAEANMFEITLSQESKKNLLRVYSLARWLFIVMSVLTTLHVALHVLRAINYYHYTDKLNWFYFIELRMLPFVFISFTLLSWITNYQYFRFAAVCKKSIDTGDAELFNNSLKWLVLNNKIGLVLCVAEVLIAVFYLCHEVWELFKTSNPA